MRTFCLNDHEVPTGLGDVVGQRLRHLILCILFYNNSVCLQYMGVC